MKHTLIQNIKTDSSGKWVSIHDVESVIDTVIAQAIDIVSKTGTQCAFTTFDLGIVQCTIQRSVNELKSHFGVK